jgi:hypothetical protein
MQVIIFSPLNLRRNSPTQFPFFYLAKPGKHRENWRKGWFSEPFLPSGDQDRKGGFATLPEQPPTAGRFTHEIPAEIKSFLGCFGRKTGCEPGNSEELGTRLDPAKSPVLERHPFIGLCPIQSVKRGPA